jgi:hypothetical protein
LFHKRESAVELLFDGLLVLVELLGGWRCD